jgi:hypothetical protein
VQKWLPVALAMPRMLTELVKRPEAGLLYHRSYISGRVILVYQYWEGFEKLWPMLMTNQPNIFPPGRPSAVQWERTERSAHGTRLI